jgi:hypothetical protein
MIVMGGNLRAHDREFPHIVGSYRAGVTAHVGQRVEADRTDLRIMLAHMVNVIRVGIGTVALLFMSLIEGCLHIAERN